MTTRTYAVIEDGYVVNRILWNEDDTYLAPEGTEFYLAPDEVEIGWQRVNEEWIAPTPPEPLPVPTEDPVVTEAKRTAVAQLVALGVTESVARTIVGLPPL